MSGAHTNIKENSFEKFTPKVSIIIPVYNGTNFLNEAIDSALGQDYPNLEVIIVNDGSTDQGATERMALSYGDKIRYFNKENGGVATALNYGITKMTGEYFSWLSHDDMYMKNKISKEIEALAEQEDRTRVVCCGYQVIDENKKNLYEINPLMEYGKEKLEIPLFPVFLCCINGCALLIHKSHFERVGMFNENLSTTQDYDLWFRILRGQQMCFIDGPYFYSRNHEAQDSRKLYKAHIEECNALWIRLFDSLTLEEKEKIGGSEFEFLYQAKLRFMQSDYKKIVCYLECELRKLLEEKIDATGIMKILSNYETQYLSFEKEKEEFSRWKEQYNRENSDYKKKYEDICNSTCWKITRPFRWVRNIIKMTSKAI